MGNVNYGLQEWHKISLSALTHVYEICCREGIPCFLVAGSVLGAKRHGGVIPWDDDIDIGILHCDGMRLEKALVEGLPEEYKYISFYSDTKYPRMHAKVLYKGRTCVDIFPYVKVPDNEYLAKIQWFIRRLTEKLYYRKVDYVHDGETEKIVRLSGLVAKLITRKNVLRLSEWNCKLYAHKKTKRYVNLYSIYTRKKETIPAEWVDDLAYISFEGKQFSTLSHVDEYLVHMYGDWMNPPPVEKRRPAHQELF